ncbi:sensor histidine kinase [Rhodovulum sp. DZ06]|uniref:sensor histidine kinase n=1 Tax=Rhodovulum sp. DZ06 TaxID=3425126 RepID=UPI003D358840
MQEMEELEQARALKRFALIAAHDLAQPLNTVEGALAALAGGEGGALPPEAAELLDLAAAAAARMRLRIDALMDEARAEAAPPAFARVELDALLSGCLQDLAPVIRAAGAEIRAGPLPAVRGDLALLGQALQNMLANALAHQRRDRRLLAVVEARAAGGGMVALRVADNGPGVPPERRAAAFEPFTRLQPGAEQVGAEQAGAELVGTGRPGTEQVGAEQPGTGQAGAGLGLALCALVAARHGGRAWIEDGIDGGAAVALTLPRAD